MSIIDELNKCGVLATIAQNNNPTNWLYIDLVDSLSFVFDELIHNAHVMAWVENMDSI